MNRRLLVLLSLASAARLLGVGMGDTYEQVLAEKGPASGKAAFGEVIVLTYPGQTIRLEHGKVASVKGGPSASTHAPAKPVAPAAVAVVAKPPAPATPPPAPARLTWSTDYAGALAEAKTQNRRVFLFFTGSDWCGWCTRLDREILSTAEFSRYAGENLLLVKLDFPHNTPLSPEVVAQNKRLARQYHVNGFPTIVVLDHSGRAVKRLGYQEGGPAPFVSALAQLHD